MRGSAVLAWILSGLALFAVADARAAEILRHDARVSLIPEQGLMRVHDRMRVRGAGLFRFALSPAFVIEHVELDGRQATLPIDLGPGPRDADITIDYQGPIDPAGGLMDGGDRWYPRIIGQERGFDYSVSVETPRAIEAVMPGRRKGALKRGRSLVSEFVSEQASDDLVLIYGALIPRFRAAGDVGLRVLLPPEAADMAVPYLDAMERHLARFQRLLGPYPFQEFTLVGGPLPIGVAFPGVAYMNARMMRLPFARARSLAHEVLHNWWGHAVDIDYAGGNWAEALTTYMADYGLAESQGQDQAMRRQWLRDYAALPADADRPLRAFRGRRHDADQIIGYGKGAMVFHMLRRLIGDEAFYRGLKRLGAWRARAGWNDLRAIFAAASGRDLDAFFEQWLERTGAPQLAVTAAVEPPGPDGFTVTLRVTQGTAAAYQLALPVTIETDAGPINRQLALALGRAAFSVPVTARPRAVTIDPGSDLFLKLDPRFLAPIFRDVTLGKSVRVTLLEPSEAAHQLAARLLGGDAGAGGSEAGPRLVIGTSVQVRDYLAKLDLGVPDTLQGRGTARAWAARDKRGSALMLVEADQAGGLAQMLRPLPHYRRMGFVVVENGQVIDKGTWPDPPSPFHIPLK